MAVQEDLEQQNSLRISDSVLLLSNETSEFVFSELSSSQHNSVALSAVDSQRNARFPNVHFATFKVVAANKYKKQERYSEIQAHLKEQGRDEVTSQDEEKHVMLLAERDLEDEIRENEAEQERQTGKLIVYGEVVQLLHTLTKKYLYVNTTEIARTELRNRRVELKEGNNLGCHFRILPRDKVRSVGNVVRYGDQIKVESVKTGGQFLHCSFRTFQKKLTVHANCHEINLSATESSFTLIPHYCSQSMQPPNALRAGKAVRLLHREHKGYIFAGGSFAYKQLIAKDVHCRKLHSKYDGSKAHLIPASTYWQVEKESDPLSGQPLFWGERCRIKHMPTRRYLAVVNPAPGDYRVTLKEWDDFDQLDTLFIISPFIKERSRGAILLDSYARLKHLHTATWLHLQKGTNSGHESERESSKLLQLTASTSLSSDDAFKLEQVEESLLDKFNYVAGIIPVLTTHIKECKKSSAHVPGNSYPVECTLKELAQCLMVCTDSRDRKYCQNLLKNLMVPELIIEIIKTLSDDSDDDSEKQKVCQAGSHVIESYLKGDSQRGENYLPRLIEIFRQQRRMHLNADEMIFEMVPDNIATFTKMTDTEIEGMIQKLILTKEVLYQTEIGDPARLSGTDSKVVYFRKPKSRDWRKLTDIAGHNITEKDDKDDLEYLQAQLHLFRQLCKGNNGRCITALDKRHISFEEALLCAQDENLCPSIRSQYVELIKVMYVDVGENNTVLPFSFAYMKVDEDPSAQTGGVVNPYRPKLKAWIENHLSKQVLQREVHASRPPCYVSPSPLIASCLEENKLLAQVLDVLSLLVKLGYYTDKLEVEKVMKHLIAILDGTTDAPSKTETDDQVTKDYRCSGRFTSSTENLAIFTVKQKAMEVMELFYNIRCYIRLQRLIFDFRLLKDGTGGHRGSPTPPARMKTLLHKGTKILKHPALVKLVLERLKLIFAESAFFYEVPIYMSGTYTGLPQFSAVMLDLANYHSDDLIQGSLHLLNQCYSAEINLFSKAIQTQLLVTQSSQDALEIIRGQLCNLRRLLSVDGGRAGRSQIISILQTFTEMCTLNGREQEAHPQNQQILYSSGVLTDVLNYVLHTEDRATVQLEAHPKEAVEKGLQRKRAPHPSSIEAVFVACFTFLRVMAHGNIRVKQRLYDRLNDLLEVNVAVEYMSEMLTEVFTGGPEFCFKVKAEHIQKIFSIVASGENMGSCKLINTLQALAKIASVNVPVKRNQDLIMKYFTVNRRKFFDHLLGKGKKGVRMNILREELDGDFDLQLLLNITDLLAVCAKGNNLSIQSACQEVLSANELLEILMDPHLPLVRKRPFIQFLVSVYLKTEEDGGTTDIRCLEDSSEMWTFLNQSADLVHNIGEVLMALPSTEHITVRERLSSPSRTIHTDSKAIPFVTRENGEFLPGVLLYFCDGMLPLLQIYFEKFFNPDLMGRERLNITGNILTNLLHFSAIFTKCFSESAHVKLYHSTVKTVLKKCQEDASGYLNVNQQVVDNFEVIISTWSPPMSHNKQAYLDGYADESNLNEAFNTFITNVQLAYQGPNTARDQIGAKFTTTYSSFLDEQMKLPGDEYLPLGPRFQDHVQLFVNKKAGPTSHSHPINVEIFVTESVKRLLAQLEVSFNKLKSLGEVERCRQDELDIKCLQILRAIIHNEIMCIGPKDLNETDPVKFRRRCKKRLHPIQNRIQNFDNAIARVVPLLTHPNDAVAHEVLAFLKAILYSGNPTVQQGMQHLLNTQDEKLFLLMRALLQNASMLHRERQTLLVQVKERGEEDLAFQESTGRFSGQEPPSHVQQSQQLEVAIDIFDDREAIGMHSLQQREQSVATLPPESRGHTPSRDARTAVSSKGKQRDEALQLQDSTNIKLALRVLGLMCDGQYRQMQNYLREQPNENDHINIVEELVLFLQVSSTELNADTIELVHLILQTLLKLCMGNYPNQEVVFKCQIIDALNGILELKVDDKKNTKHIIDLIKLKGSAVRLLEVMLEETDKRSKDLAKEIYLTVHIDALHSALAFFYRKMKDSRVRKKGFGDKAEKGLFTTYHVLVHLADYPETCTLENLDPKTVAASNKRNATSVKTQSGAIDAWQFCKRRSKSIEVKYKNMNDEKVLTKVHFQYDPKKKLREEVIEKVKWNVNRDSLEDKHRDFLEWMFATSKDVIHYSRLRKHWLTHLLISKPIWRYWILIFLSCVLNLFLLIIFTLPPNLLTDNINNVTIFDYHIIHNASGAIVLNVPQWINGLLLYTVGLAHFFFSLWMLVEYFVVNLPNFVRPWWISQLLSLLFSKCGYQKPKETYSDINILGLHTIYVVVFLLASGSSFIFYGYFYAFCLLHIIVNNDILQRVLRAVTKHGISLLWVAILTLVVTYIYAVVSFAFLQKSFLAENNDAEFFCRTLLQCFISVTRYGLIDGSWELRLPLVPSDWETSGLRLLFDVSFFVIVTTIALNIVFGIIVDTFSELRDERFRAEQDSKNLCFICGRPSHEFERKSEGFDNHVKREHNMWDYIYFSIYLETVDIRDQNAIESYLCRMIKEKEISFFPLLQARALENDTAQRIEEFKKVVDGVLLHIQEEEGQKSATEKVHAKVGGPGRSSS